MVSPLFCADIVDWHFCFLHVLWFFASGQYRSSGMMCIFLSGIFSLCALCLYGLDKNQLRLVLSCLGNKQLTSSSSLTLSSSVTTRHNPNKFGFCARCSRA